MSEEHLLQTLCAKKRNGFVCVQRSHCVWGYAFAQLVDIRKFMCGVAPANVSWMTSRHTLEGQYVMSF